MYNKISNTLCKIIYNYKVNKKIYNQNITKQIITKLHVNSITKRRIHTNIRGYHGNQPPNNFIWLLPMIFLHIVNSKKKDEPGDNNNPPALNLSI